MDLVVAAHGQHPEDDDEGRAGDDSRGPDGRSGAACQPPDRDREEQPRGDEHRWNERQAQPIVDVLPEAREGLAGRIAGLPVNAQTDLRADLVEHLRRRRCGRGQDPLARPHRHVPGGPGGGGSRHASCPRARAVPRRHAGGDHRRGHGPDSGHEVHEVEERVHAPGRERGDGEVPAAAAARRATSEDGRAGQTDAHHQRMVEHPDKAPEVSRGHQRRKQRHRRQAPGGTAHDRREAAAARYERHHGNDPQTVDADGRQRWSRHHRQTVPVPDLPDAGQRLPRRLRLQATDQIRAGMEGRGQRQGAEPALALRLAQAYAEHHALAVAVAHPAGALPEDRSLVDRSRPHRRAQLLHDQAIRNQVRKGDRGECDGLEREKDDREPPEQGRTLTAAAAHRLPSEPTPTR